MTGLHSTKTKCGNANMAKDHVFCLIVMEKVSEMKPLWFASTLDRVLLAKGMLRELKV